MADLVASGRVPVRLAGPSPVPGRRPRRPETWNGNSLFRAHEAAGRDQKRQGNVNAKTASLGHASFPNLFETVEIRSITCLDVTRLQGCLWACRDTVCYSSCAPEVATQSPRHPANRPDETHPSPSPSWRASRVSMVSGLGTALHSQSVSGHGNCMEDRKVAYALARKLRQWCRRGRGATVQTSTATTTCTCDATLASVPGSQTWDNNRSQIESPEGRVTLKPWAYRSTPTESDRYFRGLADT